VKDILKNKVPVVWSIAGSDCGGGTGIQADLHTFHDFEVYGATVITALSAQNSFARGYVLATERRSVVAQINALDSDMPALAIKVGMIPNREILETIVKYLQDSDAYVVYDPELEASGEGLLAAMDLLKGVLLPRVDLLVVNTREVDTLAATQIVDPQSMAAAANTLLLLGARSVLITGAQFVSLPGRRVDYWSDGTRCLWVQIETVDTVNNRGGGSTLSAALTAAAAKGLPIDEALSVAKAYVTQGIRLANRVGSGPGSVAHQGLPTNQSDRPAISAQWSESC
jgi:hydroxymethylpyrimidine kinase/phosphomethylpyrimidine kinase/thiamine-phosphate diphosphorylase